MTTVQPGPRNVLTAEEMHDIDAYWAAAEVLRVR